MPPPTHRCARPSASAKVRIVSARSKSPSGRTTPSAPIDAPRPTGSSAAIRSTAAIFGAPVTDPPGNVAPRIEASVASSRSRPSTVETRCVTPASSRCSISSGQRIEPGSHTRARSFRSRSTIITCSAASFGSSTSSPAGRVPLIGIVCSSRPRRARKRSGEAETIAQPSPTSGRGASGRSGASAAANASGDRPRTAPTGAGRDSPGRRRRARSPRAPPRSPPRSRRRPTSAPTRRRGARDARHVRGSGPRDGSGRRAAAAGTAPAAPAHRRGAAPPTARTRGTGRRPLRGAPRTPRPRGTPRAPRRRPLRGAAPASAASNRRRRAP